VGQNSEKVGHRRTVSGHMRRKAYGHERVYQARGACHGDGPTIQEGAAATLRGEAFITHGIVDCPHENFIAPCQGDGNAPRREAVHVVARAVERIDHPPNRWLFGRCPAQSAGRARVLGNGFLTDESMLGKGLEHHAADLSLRSEVGLGDKIARTLVRHAESAHPVQEHLPPRASRGLTYLQGTVWDR